METKILGLLASRRMRGLVFMASGDRVDVDTFHKGIQYALEKLGKSRNLALKAQQYQILKANDTKALRMSLLIIPELRVLVLTKRHVGSGNEIAKCQNGKYPLPLELQLKGRAKSLHKNQVAYQGGTVSE